MEKQFKDFCENIRLTSQQETDAQTKYSGVCKMKLNTMEAQNYFLVPIKPRLMLGRLQLIRM